MEFIGVPIAVLTMFLAQQVERRMGPAAAGWFAALPVSFAVASATIAVTDSETDAALIAWSAAGHVGPMVAYAVAFALLIPRAGLVLGFGLATLAYVAASLALVPAPPTLSVGVGILAIVIAFITMARRPQAARIGQRATRAQQVLSLASAALVVTLIAAANQRVGPTFAGAVGAFPVMTTTMALFIAHRSGAAYAATVMRGLIKSLPIYLTYCLVFAFTVTRLPTSWAVFTALVLALVLAVVTWRRVERPGSPDDLLLYAEP